jgi:hypothetical protein
MARPYPRGGKRCIARGKIEPRYRRILSLSLSLSLSPPFAGS